MATVQFIPSQAEGDPRSKVCTWTLTQANADGSPVGSVQWADRCIHFSGTFGTATVVLQGSSNGGTSWKTLSDPQGVALSFTAEALKQITEVPLLIRPFVTGGDGTTSISCVLTMRRIV